MTFKFGISLQYGRAPELAEQFLIKRSLCVQGSIERNCSESFEQTIELAEPMSVPSWCSLDCKTGAVAISLDELSYAECYLYNDTSDVAPAIFNVGVRVLRFLFQSWILHRSKEQLSASLLEPIRLPLSCWVSIIRDGVCVDLRRRALWTGDEPIPTWAQKYLRVEPGPAPRTACVKLKPATSSILMSQPFFHEPARKITGAGHTRLYNMAEFIARSLKLTDLPEELSCEARGWANVFEFYCKEKVRIRLCLSKAGSFAKINII